ncbi:hypothetical protein DL96DRAFT_1584481 [Flagelloscypha sp. PMI_526]|nr:hypothetical protein DL96DRAFT_1584481 [Flagelloscypha sp. PMI_526]
MWAGQFFGEGLNWVIKRIVKQERPILEIGDGYGFPSSHSQYMGYFTSFLVCHLYFRHRFASSGFPLLDQLWRICVYAALYGWAGVVAYSRYHLGYHAPHQIYWGLGIGIMLGTSLYFVAELLPSWYPKSLLGQLKKFAVTNPISTWCQIRDGWALWADGGRHSEWLHWKQGWTEQQRLLETGKTKKR